MNDASDSYKPFIFLVITAVVVALIYGSSPSFYIFAELPDSRFAGIQPLALGQDVLPQEQESILQEQPSSAQNCDPSYPDVCIASPPPDLDCGDVPYNNIQVVGSDPHGFDSEGDGIGCESVVSQEQPQVVTNNTQVSVDATTFMKIVEPFIAEFERSNPTLKIGTDGMVYNRVVDDAGIRPLAPSENALQAQMIGKDSISLNTTVQRPLFAGDLLPVPIPQKSNFTFGSGSPLCPANDCKQEFISAQYSTMSPESPAIQGTLKIENKTTSTPDIIKYSLIPFAGNFHITSIEENRKTANNVLALSGEFGLGGGTTVLDAGATPEFKYNVNGTFDNATKVLIFDGERITS